MFTLLLADPDLADTIAREGLFKNTATCRILLARTQPELFLAARDGLPQLVILDADRFNADIDTLLERLHAMPSLHGTPIIATTGDWTEPYEKFLIAAGADAVIAKPVEPARLYDIVRAAEPAMELDIRVPAGVPAEYAAGGTRREGRIVNVSKGGLFLECESPEPVGTHLAVALSLPAFTNRLSVEGVVTWVNDAPHADATQVPRGMGVQFRETPAVVRKTIALYVAMAKTVTRVT